MARACWVVGEVGADGALAKLSTEVATLARDARREAAGRDVDGRRHRRPTRRAAAAELAAYVPRVLAVTEPAAADRRLAGAIAAGALAGARRASRAATSILRRRRARTAATSPVPLSALTGLGRPGQRDGGHAGRTTGRSSR